MKGKLGKCLLAAVLLCLAFCLVVGLFGQVVGEEFCPQRFTVRGFSYYQIPFANVQITPVAFSTSSRGNTVLSSHLKTNKLLGRAGRQLRWDIVHLGGLSPTSNRGDAEILLKYLEQPGAVGSESWLEWTQNKKHKEIVELFWPLIGILAEEQLYILMPDAFDWARAATSQQEFAQRVHKEVPASIQQLADAERQRNNTKRADQLELVAAQVAKLQPVVTIASSTDDENDVANQSEVEAESDPEDLDVN